MEQTNLECTEDVVSTAYVETMPKMEGFFNDPEDTACTVKVAMRIRPLNSKEQRESKGNTCITTQQELAKLVIGAKEFFFDKVFDQESR